jgi:spore maturation protein CgeB
MKSAGYSPSVRLFEAGACGCSIITDHWEGLSAFFEPGKEILMAESPDDIRHYLIEMSDEERATIGRNARRRVLSQHSSIVRAAELEGYIDALN